MRVVPINEAEAMIETYFGAAATRDPKTGTSILDEYTWISEPISLKEQKLVDFKITWCAVELDLKKKISEECYVEISRPCNIFIKGYDELRIFGAVGTSLELTVTAVIDGTEQVIVDTYRGDSATTEIVGNISGEFLESLTMRFRLTEDRRSMVRLSWIGLANATRVAEMVARPAPYEPEWYGYMYQDDSLVEYKPRLGIMFDEEELEAIRRKVKKGYLKQVFEELKAEVKEYLSMEPEKWIGTYAPSVDQRWIRVRDRGKKQFQEPMKILAFVGLVDQNPDMCRMAVRIALSAAHCTYWTESHMGVFPGDSWHHRSFLEQAYCTSCAYVLDWCGHFLTPYGRNAIEDAIIMKGLPRIESDFKRHEYIKHMNQGIVFSAGRIIGMLALVKLYPGYRSLIEEAEADLHQMIEEYVLSDGGTAEGVSYWDYTFATCMPIFTALSRFHGKSFQEYATPTLLKTGNFAKDNVSIQNGGYRMININDAETLHGYAPNVLAAFYQLSGDKDFLDLLSVTIKSGAPTRSDKEMMLVQVPEEFEPAERYIHYALMDYPVTGFTHIVRKGKECDTCLYAISGTRDNGHGHDDKGSFILETDKESFCIDRGKASYSSVETVVMAQAAYHNLFYPEKPDGSPSVQRTLSQSSSVATYANGVFRYSTNVTAAWEEGLFKHIERRITSDKAEEFVIEDFAELYEAMPMSFRVNTTLPAVIEDGGVRIVGEYNEVLIQPMWNAEMTVQTIGVNGDGVPVNLIRLVSPVAVKHEVATKITVVEKGKNSRCCSGNF